MTSSLGPLMNDRSYRLYSLSAENAINGAENREFDSDAEALLHARTLLARHPAVEIWQTHRLVRRLSRGDLGKAVA